MAHTPGPWRTSGTEKWSDGVERCMIGSEARGYAVAEVCVQGRRQTVEANAHLIAAAPDLLEACKKLLTTIDRNGLRMTTVIARQLTAAHAAVAKAEGHTE